MYVSHIKVRGGGLLDQLQLLTGELHFFHACREHRDLERPNGVPMVESLMADISCGLKDQVLCKNPPTKQNHKKKKYK